MLSVARMAGIFGQQGLDYFPGLGIDLQQMHGLAVRKVTDQQAEVNQLLYSRMIGGMMGILQSTMHTFSIQRQYIYK
jgi:hypothetical protein